MREANLSHDPLDVRRERRRCEPAGRGFGPSRPGRLVIGLLGLLACLNGSACSRAWYRQQTDQQVLAVIREKEQAAGIGPNLRPVAPGPEPASRLFDPHSVDRPPLPPDDPLAHGLMHCVDGKRGYSRWHDGGDLATIENATWAAFLPWNDAGQVALDRRAAVRCAFLHSRDYQDEVEDLYLSALDVTFERFRFETQSFLGGSTNSTFAGRRHPLGGPRSFSELSQQTDLEIRKLSATGGELVVGLANSLIWEFSGEDRSFATTLLDFTLVQPLLRFGGQARVLERLTQSERNLLANVRQMEQFKQGFTVQILTGRDAGDGPVPRGLVGAAGLGLLAGTPAGRTGGPTARGYYGLLQTQQQIHNQEGNVAALRDSLAQLDAAFEAGRIPNRLQVDQARQALYNAQSSLSVARAAYQTEVDTFKLRLGLPPELELVIEDTYLDRFNLISPELTQLQNQVADYLEQIRAADREGDREAVAAGLRGLAATRGSVAAQLDQARSALETLRQSIPRRQDQLRRIAQRHQDESSLDEGVFDPQRLPATANQLQQRLDALSEQLDQVFAGLEQVKPIESPAPEDPAPETPAPETPAPETPAPEDPAPEDPAPEDPAPETPAPGTQASESSGLNPPPAPLPPPGELPPAGELPPPGFGSEKRLGTRLSELLLELLLIQAKARLESILLNRIEADQEVAFTIAEANRLDWMNARARLVDSWRQIEFTANALQSDLDILVGGELRTQGNNPVKFHRDAGRLRTGMAFDTPITRLAERNDFRAAQINYQRARRDYMRFADQVRWSLRNTLRLAELNELNFELRRGAVDVAIAQVDLARLRLNEPPRGANATTFSPTTARDLVSALGDLLDAQNDFLDVWVSYEVLRMLLDFELGTLRLDDDGMWLDPGPIRLP